jgi:hypothetical protein
MDQVDQTLQVEDEKNSFYALTISGRSESSRTRVTDSISLLVWK